MATDMKGRREEAGYPDTMRSRKVRDMLEGKLPWIIRHGNLILLLLFMAAAAAVMLLAKV